MSRSEAHEAKVPEIGLTDLPEELLAVIVALVEQDDEVRSTRLGVARHSPSSHDGARASVHDAGVSSWHLPESNR